MEEERAHRLYQDLKAAGSGAAQFKQGLGYGQGSRPPAPSQPPPAPSPSLPSLPAGQPSAARPPPLLPPPVPGQRPAHAFHPPPPGVRGPSFPPPPMMPPRGPPPPGYRPAQPMPPPPYMAAPPQMGYTPPHPGHFLPPGQQPTFGRPPYPQAPRPLPTYLPVPTQQQPRPFPGQPYMPGPPFVPQPQPPVQGQQEGQAAEGKPAAQGQGPEQPAPSENDAEQERQHRQAEQQRKREEAAAAAAAEEAAKRKQAEASAWAAYKSEDGSLYYYNAATGHSSWERPEGFEGDADRASAHPLPVSSEKVAGTDWLEVVCDDHKKYYYNARSGQTSWQVPPEVEAKARVKLDPAKAAMLERVKAAGAQLAPEYQVMVEEGGGHDHDVSFTEEDIAAGGRSHMQGAGPGAGARAGCSAGGGPPATAPLLPPARTAPQQAAQRAATAREQPQFHPRFGMLPAVPPPLRPKGTGFGPDGFWAREQGIAAFKELLSDNGIHAFSRWERELPKLQPDPRFKYVPVSERRALFEEFCKEVAANRSKASGGARPAGSKAAGAAAGRGARSVCAQDAGGAEEEGEEEGGAQQLQQSGEAGFEALLAEIQEACTVEPRAGSANGAAADGGGESEGVDVVPGGTPLVRWGAGLSLEQLEPMWGSDPRWRRCRPELRQQLFSARIDKFEEAARREVEEGFRELLREVGVCASWRWSKTKDVLRGDPRYKAAPREQREALFRQYTAQLQAVEEAEHAKQAQREEREREAQRKLEAERRAAEQRQRQAAHSDAVANYRALLTELVRDCDATWREMQPRLAKDPQGRGPSNPALERGEAEKLFRDHVQGLLDTANDAFLDLLDATLPLLLPSKSEQDLSGLPLPLLRYKDAAKMLDADPRFHRLPADVREVRWRRYVDDMLFNRDYPNARPRTQRRPKREGSTHVGGGREEAGAVSGRRPREEGGGSGSMDKAYAREYLQPDRKRMRQD